MAFAGGRRSGATGAGGAPPGPRVAAQTRASFYDTRKSSKNLDLANPNCAVKIRVYKKGFRAGPESFLRKWRIFTTFDAFSKIFGCRENVYSSRLSRSAAERGGRCPRTLVCRRPRPPALPPPCPCQRVPRLEGGRGVEESTTRRWRRRSVSRPRAGGRRTRRTRRR